MLCEAHRLDTQAARSGDVEARKRQPLIGDAIIIAVLVEQGGLRKDYKKGHGLEGKSDVHGASDVMDGLKAYLKLESEPVAEIVAESTATLAEGDPDKLKMLEAAREQLKKKCEALNVSYTGFCEAMELVNNIRGRLKVEHLYASDYDAFDATRYNLYKQIMLHGSVNRLFQLEPRSGAPTYRDVLRDYGRERNYQGERFGNYGITKFSTLTNAQETSFTPLVVGKLQEFRARDSMGVNTVLNQVTSIPAEVFMAWAMEHNPPLLDKVKVSENELTGRYAGKGDLEIALPTTGQRKKTATALAEKLKKQSISNGSWEEYARNSRHDRGIS